MPKLNITWAGVSSDSVGAIITSSSSNDRPKRKMDVEKVPGRNGDIIFVQDAWENIEREYDLISGGRADLSAPGKFRSIAEWLCMPEGYDILKDSSEPGYFFRAYLEEGFDVENLLTRYGRATIKFNCRPERFLDSGEVQTVYHNGSSFTAYNSTYPGGYTVSPTEHTEAYVNTGSVQTATLSNPTRFNSRPYIYIYGTNAGTYGSLTIRNQSTGIQTSVYISEVNDFMRMDCDTMNIYRSNTQNKNNLVTISNSENEKDTFPVLTPGTNTITWGGSIQAIAVKPRWWTL